MLRTIFGTWLTPSKFKYNGDIIPVYAYRFDIDKLGNSFPFDCYIMLEGNMVKQYIKSGS